MVMLIKWQLKDSEYDDVIKWKHFPRCWPFVRGIHRLPVINNFGGRVCKYETLVCGYYTTKDGHAHKMTIKRLRIWWRHQVETFSALLAFCAGNSSVTGDFPAYICIYIYKGQWRRALMFSLICSWTNSWTNNEDAGDLRRHRAHYDVTVMNSFNSIAMSNTNRL